MRKFSLGALEMFGECGELLEEPLLVLFELLSGLFVALPALSLAPDVVVRVPVGAVLISTVFAQFGTYLGELLDRRIVCDLEGELVLPNLDLRDLGEYFLNVVTHCFFLFLPENRVLMFNVNYSTFV